MQKNGTLRIHYVGQLKSSSSWAHVGRQIVLTLDRLGHDVTASCSRGFLHDSGFPLPDRLREILGREPNSDIILTFSFPPNYSKLKGGKKAGILVYETSRLPKTWVNAINSELSLLIVPSTFVKEISLASGVREKLVRVVPHGYDPALFHPAVQPWPRPAGNLYTFMTSAIPHKRKGIEILLEAFTAEFDSSHPVVLLIHSPYAPKPGREKPWETRDVRILVEEAKSRVAHPPRIISTVETINSSEMPAFLASCDCYVQPSLSEGFGLAILEAMALGKPVIATGWGGHMDFCNAENAYIVDYNIVPAGDVQYDNDDPSAFVAMPCVKSLRKQMRNAFIRQSEARNHGRTAQLSTRHLTWNLVVRKLVRELRWIAEGEGSE